MPSASDPRLYDAIYRATESVVGVGDAALEKYKIRLAQATPLFRYASGKVSDGGEANTRKIWTSLDRDTGNRWTGKSPDGAECTDGRTGLYMSLEREGGADTVFSELFHYQALEDGDKTFEILFQEYRARQAPELVGLDAKKMFYMFMYHLKAATLGWDLNLESPLITEVYERAVGSGVFGAGAPTKKEVYGDSARADFCRAIGNCCLVRDPTFLYVSSTRNYDNINVIFAGPGGPSTDPIPFLEPAGRSTFYVSATGAESAVTIEDMSYNAQFGS